MSAINDTSPLAAARVSRLVGLMDRHITGVPAARPGEAFGVVGALMLF